MRWLIGTFLIVTLFAAIPGLTPTAEALIPDEALLRLFPVDSSGMIFIDIAALRENPLVHGYLLEGPEIQMPTFVAEFSRRTGLHPKTDLDQVMLGRLGKSDFLGVARANHDLVDVEQHFRDSNSEVESYEGRSIYQPPSESDWSVSIIDDLVLMGRTDSVRAAIDRMEISAQSALDNPDLIEGILSVEEGSQVWAVGTLLDVVLPEAQAPPMAVDLIASLERITYQMRLDSAMTILAVGEFTTPETARRTVDLLRGLVALGNMQVSEREDLAPLFDGLEIDGVESSVEIRFSADGELLRRMTRSGLPIPPLSD